jgi:hypothetical protein
MMFERGYYPPHVQVDEASDVCEHCGQVYKKFRTGLTFTEVRNMYWVTDTNSEKWKYKRRNTVLGKWREIKQDMWKTHLYDCASDALHLLEGDNSPISG